MSDLTVLSDHLKAERIVLSNAFPMPRRYAVHQLIRLMDGLYLRAMSDEAQRNEYRKLFRRYEMGYRMLLSLYLDDSASSEVTPLFSFEYDIFEWTRVVSERAYRLTYAEVILDLVKAGLMQFDRCEDGASFYFSTSEGRIGIESVEADDLREHQRYTQTACEQTLQRHLEKEDTLVSKMMRLTDVWNNYYIKYGADEEVDAYYATLATQLVPSHFGSDAFPSESRFVNCEFWQLLEVGVHLSAWALKHWGFCRALMRKRPGLILENISTIPVNINSFREALCDATGFDKAQITQILDFYTLSSSNVARHTKSHRPCKAPLIRVGRGQYVRSIAGSVSEPFSFMLISLKEACRADWDRNLDLRETHFRCELYDMFKGAGLQQADNAVRIKSSKGNTDIDALLINERCKTMAVFQLKWQDPFASDLRERWSRKTNLERETSHWLDKVECWIKESSVEYLKRTGVVNPDTVRIYIFILGRVFSQFSGIQQPDPRAAWGNWYQVLNLLREQLAHATISSSDPISWLDGHLRTAVSHRSSSHVTGHETIDLGRYKLHLSPLSAQS